MAMAWPCRRSRRGRRPAYPHGNGSEHRVGIGSPFRHRLYDVPVLHHFAALDAQDVDNGDPSILSCELAVRGHGNEVAIREYSLERVINISVLGKERFQEFDGRVAPGLCHGVVLDVPWIDPGFERLAHLLRKIKLAE